MKEVVWQNGWRLCEGLEHPTVMQLSERQEPTSVFLSLRDWLLATDAEDGDQAFK